MFRRHALRSGAHVRITNCGIEVARRCEAAGLGVTSVRSQLQRSEPQRSGRTTINSKTPREWENANAVQ
jgi:hypothetical protein